LKQNLQRKEVPRRYLFSFAKTPNETTPKHRMKFRQNAERNSAKSPNEIPPKRRTKFRQNAERKRAKSPKRLRKRDLQISRKAGMLSEKKLESEVAYALTLG